MAAGQDVTCNAFCLEKPGSSEPGFFTLLATDGDQVAV